MKAVITGASSGMGADFARILSKQGYTVVLIARREDRLQTLKDEIEKSGGNAQIIVADLSQKSECERVYEMAHDDVSVLINNAGFGIWGEFIKTDMQREMQLIDVNVRAVHILTKLYLHDFVRADKGYILNVASSAAFLPGPLLNSYYASKAYVLRLSDAVYEELRRKKSNVYIGSLCPGPVQTEFDAVANVNFALKGKKSCDVAEYAVEKMFAKKRTILPGMLMKMAVFAERLLPTWVLLRISYYIQHKKNR